jgi:cellobiose dehydrogenase (acceptor)
MHPIDIHSINSSPIFSIYLKTGGNYGIPDYDTISNGSDTKHRMIFSSNELHGQTRYYQGSCAPNPDSVPDITTYLTHGSTSTGVLGLDSNQYTVIEKSPYMQTADDRRAARAFIQQLVNDI